MADLTLTYKGNTIAELDDSGSKTIRTAGKFCEADIGVAYVKPSGAEPQYGLVAEYTVAEPVSLITITLPQLVLEDHRLFVELVELTHTSDYLYPSINEGGTTGAYFAKAATENTRFQMLFGDAKTIAGKAFCGGFGVAKQTVSGDGGGRLSGTNDFAPSFFKLALYNANSVFTGGTVRLYGRIQ